jgi:dihydrofolate reductase
VTRRLTLFIAASLDGYIAGPGGDLAWLFHDADYGHSTFYARVDTVLMGRRTYETALSFPKWPYAGRKAIVFSRRGELAVASPDTVATGRAPCDVIAELRARDGGTLWLVGGGEVARACFDAELVDDLIVSIHPLLLGGGTPLVSPGTRRTTLALIGERRFPSGLMQLNYRVERAGDEQPADRAATPDSAARPA